MTDQPRNWDRELAEIDRAIAKMPAQPAQPTAGSRTSAAAGAPVAPAPVTRRRDRAATWLWILLGLALSVVLPLWPYASSCGAGLFGYLAVVAVLLICTLLGARSSWRTRLGRAHALAIAMMIWGLVLAADAVLPRIGYARNSATWMCPASPPPTQTPTQSPAQPPAQPPAQTPAQAPARRATPAQTPPEPAATAPGG